MKIITKSSNMSKEELYNLFSPEAHINMRDRIDTTVVVDNYLMFEEEGGAWADAKRVLSLQSGKEIIVTTSESFIKEFEKIKMVFGAVKALKIQSSTTNSGREIVTCRIGGSK